MYVEAIEEVSRFTRPIHIITRNYGDTTVRPGAATMFFVNENGVAVTCKHVTDLIGKKAQINSHYAKFIEEKKLIGKNKYNQRLRELEGRYRYNSSKDKRITVQVKDMFPGVTSEHQIRYKFINHPKYDLAIMVIEDFKKPLYQSFARFLKDSSTLKQGRSLCRLGYPFPEFTNFKYDMEAEDIVWTNEGRKNTPTFPIDGILTRKLQDDKGEIFGLEISTPGLRGQSGGPLFNSQGVVCGLQSMTRHLHLGFDMKNHEYNSNGESIKVNNQPFLHVGHCISSDVIKTFLKENGIKYYEE